jgi:hypothetical protein
MLYEKNVLIIWSVYISFFLLIENFWDLFHFR